MNIFISKYINKVDNKGRVSVPVNYRSILAQENCNGIVLYSSFKNQCLEACSFTTLSNIAAIIENLDPYSSARDAFETIILGESIQLPFDSEGRVIIPEDKAQQVGITNQACFVGKGKVFEIWCPEIFNTYLASAKEVAYNNRALLKNLQQQATTRGRDE